ncbi:uncharacterized protein LOC135195092 [Macrobrachium nipponense]|uniref:uncharacterized protein LOC135195092 n=1 Tax=Macrobrachium nipponense TaxID=159736 RepID=UPI0030C8A8D3
MAHKVHFSIFVLILLCCDAQGVSEVEDNIGHKEREEYSRIGLLQNSTNGNSGNPATSTSHQTIRYSCPSPYELVVNYCLFVKCLQYDSILQGWEVARQYCQSIDGDLAWFGDKDLPLFMVYLNMNRPFYDHWIGGRRYNSTTDFEWVNGQKLPDTSSSLWDYTDNANWNCVSISVPKGYAISNHDCQAKRGVVDCFICRLT